MTFNEEKVNKFILIIDEESSILGKIIKDNLINQIRRGKNTFNTYYMSIDEGRDFVEKYHLYEFPSILFFNNKKLIKLSTGLSFNNLYNS